MSYRAFLAELERDFPSPVYFFSAADPFLCREAIRAVKERIPVAERDFNLHVCDLSSQDEEKVSVEQVLSIARTVSFFGGRRFTIVTGNLQKLPKRENERLAHYAESPAENSVLLVFHCGVLSKGMKDLFRAFKPIPIDIRGSDVPQWVKQNLSARGVEISGEAVDYIISFVGNDLGLLSGEIEKISALGKKKITVDDIAPLVAGGRHYGIFDLVNALKAGDVERVFQIYASLRDTSDDYGLIGALNWQYARLHQSQEMNVRDEAYLRRVFQLLHEADLEIKSSGRSYPMELLFIRLLRLQRSYLPYG